MAETARIRINRAPVLTLWAAVVAERLGYDREEALTLGRAVAGLNAASKARSLGLAKPGEPGARRHGPGAKPRGGAAGGPLEITLMGRLVPVLKTPAGLRALEAGQRPAKPEAVERYLETKYGEALAGARRAMEALAASLPPRALADRAFELYERFRPRIPAGASGWGARGELDLAAIRALARRP